MKSPPRVSSPAPGGGSGRADHAPCDDAHLRNALNASARGYLLKDAEPDAIIRAIVAVKEGQAIFDRGIASRVISATAAPQTDRPFPVLTDREHEILDRPRLGIRNEAIAARMGISIKTVQNNVSTILLRLGATGPSPGRGPCPRRGNGPALSRSGRPARRPCRDSRFPVEFPDALGTRDSGRPGIGRAILRQLAGSGDPFLSGRRIQMSTNLSKMQTLTRILIGLMASSA